MTAQLKLSDVTIYPKQVALVKSYINAGLPTNNLENDENLLITKQYMYNLLKHTNLYDTNMAKILVDVIDREEYLGNAIAKITKSDKTEFKAAFATVSLRHIPSLDKQFIKEMFHILWI